MNYQIVQTGLEVIIAVGLIFNGFGQYRVGAKKQTADEKKESSDAIAAYNSTIDLLKRQIEALEAHAREADIRGKNNHDEILKLQEAIQHKDQLIDQYYKTITNRNPDLETTLKEVRNFLGALNEKIGDGRSVMVK